MSAQWFTVKDVKRGKAYKSAYGVTQNYALAVAGIGNPVRLELREPVVKEPKKGDRIYGKLTEEQGTDSRIFYTLNVEPLPADHARQLDIHAQVGLKEAIGVWIAQGCNPAAYDNIKNEAIHFAKMIEEIKEEI